MAVEYSKKTNAELVDILKSRSLPHTGKKADMVARLQDADKAAADADGKSKTVSPAKVDTADDVIDWDDDDVSPVLEAGTETQVETGVRAGNADAAVGGKGAVANPTVVPNQQVDIDPSTTHDLTVGEPAVGAKETESTEAAQAVQKPEEQQQQQNGTDEPAKESEPAPAVDYSMGLAQTDIDAEIAKRKARAEKFGIVEDTGSMEAQRAAERAKRFGLGAQDASGGISGLDQPLSSDRPRKRGRGDERDDYRRGKRRDFSGRGGGRNGGDGGRRQPRNNGPAEQKPRLSAEDQAALERRRQRFG